ncbi:uncharacterized protein LOC124722199 [Schistocerca piceifrons]|uniref:uncharacterized protein LOC124722199 n=1 Tax=Schistocerca piceifrons TaxID=274613 RepID=UPI001F5E450D|nr:uncharacterized protein LOC124722199 [Schistocerca piceifrons]
MALLKANENEKMMCLLEPGMYNHYIGDAGIEVAEVLGKEGKQLRNSWFDEECKRISQEKNMAYRKMLENAYTRLAHLSRNNLCKRKNGTLLTYDEEALERWVEYFSELLESSESPIEDIPVAAEDAAIVPPPSQGEVNNKAIAKLKNSKSPGTDTIRSELLKAGGVELTCRIYKIVCFMWRKEELPEEWNVGIVYLEHKEGDLFECSNDKAEDIIGSYQCRFRPEKSTVNQVFTLRQTVEKTNEFNVGVHHPFIDFKSVYDTINWAKPFEAMREFRVLGKLVRLIEVTLKCPQCTVRVLSRLSPQFPTRTGLRGTIYYKSVQFLGYADDLDLMSRTLRDLQSAFSALKLSAEKMSLRINEGKTKNMYNGTNQPLQPTIPLDRMTFERVECFTCLSSKIEANGTTVTEIMSRVSASNRCYFGKLHFKYKLLS